MTETSPPAQTTKAASPLVQGLRLLTAVLLLFAVSVATMFAIFIFVPEQNDYALISRVKHERLESTASPRIVLIGGSNLAYGVDSALIEQRTGCPVVNMGMNGFFGTRFMLEEVHGALRPADIAVIAFEYDSFFKSEDGTDTSLAVVTKVNPSTIAFLTPQQKFSLLSGYMYGAQQKVLRLTREQLARLPGLGALMGAGEDTSDIDAIETFAGFNALGDLESHLNVTWTGPLEAGLDISHLPRNDRVIEQMQAFAAEMKQRGVTTLVSHTSIIDSFYQKHGPTIDALDARFAEAPPLVTTQRAGRDYVFPRAMMFDTDYHLNAEGRRRRSEMLAEDIIQATGGACQPEARQQHGAQAHD